MTHLRKQARNRSCQVRLPGICNDRDETVVLAHFRLIGISGAGLKGPDLIGAHACSNCHAYVDTHDDDATQRAFAEGVFRTQYLLIKEGLIQW